MRGTSGIEKSTPEFRDQLLAELFAQSPRAYFLDFARLKLAELERAERDADEPRHVEAEMAEHVAHLAVLAFADRKREPEIGALHALDRGFDGAVMDAGERQPCAQLVELRLGHLAVGAHAVAAQPAGRRQFEHAGERAVIGEEQQPLGIEIEPADADQARQVCRQMLEDGRPALRVGVGGHQPARLVIEEQPRALARRQRRAVDGDMVLRGDVAGRRSDHGTVDRHAAGRDPSFRLAPRRQAGAGDHLGDALAGFVLFGVAVHSPAR